MGTTPSKASPLAPAFQRMATWDLKAARRVLQDYKDKDMDFGLDAQGIAELLGSDTDWAESILDAFGSSTGIINALALICGTCLVSSGPALEKAGMIFDALDFDGTEQISMDEMTIAFLCCVRGFCVMAGVGSVPSDEELETVTLQAYRDLNKGSTQSISKSEFTKWVLEFAGGTKAAPNREVTLQNALEQFRVVQTATAPPTDLESDGEAGSNSHLALQETGATDDGEYDVQTTGTFDLEVNDPPSEEPVTLAEDEGFQEAGLSYQDVDEAALDQEEPQQFHELQDPQQPIEEYSESVEPGEDVAELDIQPANSEEDVIDGQGDHFDPASVEAEEYASAPTEVDDQHQEPSSQPELEEAHAGETLETQVDGAQEAAMQETEAQEPEEQNEAYELPLEQTEALDEPAVEAYEQCEPDQPMEVTQSEDTLANQETAEPLAHEETAESLAHDDIVIPDVSPELETAAAPDEQHDAYDDGDYEVRDEAEVDATTSIEPSSDPIETAAPPDEQHDVCDDGDNEARDEEEVDAPAIVEPLFDPIETAEVGDEEQAYSHDFAQGTSQVDETATATDVLRSEENTEKPPASEGRDQSDQPIDGDPAVEATPSVAEEVEVVASPDVEEAQQKPPSDQHDPAEDEARSFTTPRIHSRPATPEEDAVATEQQITEEGRSGSPLLNEDHGGGSVPENTEAEHTQVLAPSTGSPDDSVDVSVEGNAAAASELPSEQADTGEEAPSSDLNAYDTYDYQHAQVDTRSGLPPPEPLALKDEVEETTVTAPSEESAVEASVEPAA